MPKDHKESVRNIRASEQNSQRRSGKIQFFADLKSTETSCIISPASAEGPCEREREQVETPTGAGRVCVLPLLFSAGLSGPGEERGACLDAMAFQTLPRR